VAASVASSLERIPGVGLPRRHQTRFLHAATWTLVLAFALALSLASYATTNGHPEFTPAAASIGLIPLVGGLIGLWRFAAAWEAGPSRSHAVLALFSLGLLSWSVAIILYLAARARGSALIEFPSFVDVPNYVSALAWSVGVWVLYEGAVDDFLTEIEHNTYFLTLIAAICFFVLTVAEGDDFGRLLWSGHDLAKHVTESLLPLASGVNGFMLLRATRGRLGKQLRRGRSALRALAFGLLLTAIAELLFVAGVSIGTKQPQHLLAYRNGGLADVLEVSSYFLLAFGVLHFPLDLPLFHPGEASTSNDAAKIVTD
jgi:hypothetical protein